MSIRAHYSTLFALVLMSGPALAQADGPRFSSWPPLVNPFPSTGGGGVMIDGYAPVVDQGKCRTPFKVIMPDGARFNNQVEFDAVPVEGGTHCLNGRWRADDGSANGTTPFEMFIKDGVVRYKP
ncbi:hypothetical protein MCEMSEM23_02340 [Rhabdaerophilaceae bacterium]